jgi:hypothetical protein
MITYTKLVTIASLAVSFFTASAFAQAQQEAAARMAAGCGPSDVQFTVKNDKSAHPFAPAKDNSALVYVFGNQDIDNVALHIGGVITRWGVDGEWVGATDRRSYISFAVAAGEHRLCTSRQSSLKSVTDIAAALSFTAAAGKTYYFRTHTPVHNKDAVRGDEVELLAVDPAEAQILIASSSLSTFTVKR